MLALTFDGVPALRELPEPGPRAGECLIRVRMAGICRTDLEIIRGYMAFRGIPGHEFVGVVEQGSSRWLGRRVVGEINCPCGSCELCRAGMGNHCPHRSVLGISGRDGAFAEALVLPEQVLHAVPDELEDTAAVFIEPLAAALRIREQVPIDPKERVLVLGDGRLGLLCALALRPACSALQLIGKHPFKIDLARRAGIDAILREDFVPDRSVRVVVEATGRAEGLRLAMRAIRPQGVLVLKSTFAGPEPMDLAPLVIDEIQLVGSRCGPFTRAIEALRTGEVDPLPLLSSRRPLSQALEALQEAAEPRSLKVVLDMGS